MTRNQNVVSRSIVQRMANDGYDCLGVRADGSYYPCHAADIPGGAVDSYYRFDGDQDVLHESIFRGGHIPEYPSEYVSLVEITAEIMGGHSPVTIMPRHDPEADVPEGHVRLHGDWWAVSRQTGDKSYSGCYLSIYPPGSLLPGSVLRPKAPIHSFGDWVQTCYAPFGNGPARHLLITFDNELRLRIFEAPKLEPWSPEVRAEIESLAAT